MLFFCFGGSEMRIFARVLFQSAHVLAMAVQKLFPDAQVTIGPWIEKGFYYDFDMKEAFTEKDLKKIKKEMVGSSVISLSSLFNSGRTGY